MTEATANAVADKKWYAVQVLVGFEKVVRENLQERIEQHGLQERFGGILLPVEKTLEIRNGKKKEVERKLYPGYLFLEMSMAPDTWHLVRRTRRVGGFISGTNDAPSPLHIDVVDKIRQQMQDSIDKGPVMRRNLQWASKCASKTGHSAIFQVLWMRSI